jgi:hypothetical protein
MISRNSRRGQQPRPVYVSLLLPRHEPPRTQHWYVARCPECGEPHLGHARDLAFVTGPRRLPCGHPVTVMIARTYGGPGTAA